MAAVTGPVFDALGARFVVDGSGRVVGALRASLCDLATELEAEHVLKVERSGLRRWDVWWDDVNMAEGVDASMALYSALRAVNGRAAERASVDRLVLHGACVDIAGCGVAFVGDSGAGKTTLAAAAMMRGHALVCEEATAIGPVLSVAPFHRPLGVRKQTARKLQIARRRGPFRFVHPVAPSLLGSLSAGASIRLVVLPTWSNDGGRLVRLDPAEALVRLMNHTLGSVGRERAAFRAAAGLVAMVPVVELSMSDPGAALDRIGAVVVGAPGAAGPRGGSIETIPT